jgi:hypothetical protein
MRIEEKLIPITEELSLSTILIHELLHITFGYEKAFQVIDQSCAKAYDKWRDYKYHLTEEAFKDMLDNEIYKIYVEKIIEERNR